ncbi:MAG: DUF2971 domain-containing protein [Devosia sp.]
MFYKFVGGEDDAALLDVMDKVLAGSIKFTSAAHFNDPFEFKFDAVAPTREAFDAWHREHDPARSPDELENAWKSSSGPAADWNTSYAPRANILRGLFVLCLTEKWDSHLMWAHYASSHRGFAVTYATGVVEALERLPEFEGKGHVAYRTQPPPLRWFQDAPEDMLGPILFSKSGAWSYEEEFRVILSGDPETAIFKTVDPNLVTGVVLGPRSPASLIAKALAARKARPDLTVQQITAGPGYAMALVEVDDGVRRAGHIL